MMSPGSIWWTVLFCVYHITNQPIPNPRGDTHLKRWYGYVRRSRPPYSRLSRRSLDRQVQHDSVLLTPTLSKSIKFDSCERNLSNLKNFQLCSLNLAQISSQNVEHFQFLRPYFCKKKKKKFFRPQFRRFAPDIPTKNKVECPPRVPNIYLCSWPVEVQETKPKFAAIATQKSVLYSTTG